MKLNSIFFTIVLVLSFSSCIDFSNNIKKEEISDEDFKSVVTNEEYTVKIPEYMREGSGLNDEASLQYQNLFKETYFVVIDESTQDFVDIFTDLGEYDESISVVKNYKNIQLQFFQESLTEYNFLSEKATKINGFEAEMVNFDGKIQDVVYPISYTLGFVEGGEKLYMLMTWTLKDKRQKYQATFDKIITSFELVDN